MGYSIPKGNTKLSQIETPGPPINLGSHIGTITWKNYYKILSSRSGLRTGVTLITRRNRMIGVEHAAWVVLLFSYAQRL